MKLRIIKWKFVVDHCGSDREMKKAFDRFYEVAKAAEWRKPQDIIDLFKNADLIICKQESTTRIVFNIGSNKYRMIAGYFFASKQTYLYIKFVGTHAEYDVIDVCKVDMFKSK